MKVYKLYIAKPLLVFYLLMFSTFPLAGIIGIVLRPDGPPVWVFVIVLGIGLFQAYMWLRFPFEIRVRDDNMIEFRSIFRRVSLSPSQIKTVRAKRYALGFVDVIHERGKVHLINQMEGFHEFLTSLKSLNPAVEVQGC